MRIIYTLFFVAGFSLFSNAKTVYSAAGGAWTAATNIWSPTLGGAVQTGYRPAAGDIVFINHIITTSNFSTPTGLTITISGGSLTLNNASTLNFATLNISTALTTNNTSILNGGAININTGGTLTMNGSSNTVSGIGTITIVATGTFNFNSANLFLSNISNSGTFTSSNGGGIHITGNFANAGSFNDANSGTIYFEGSTQSISGSGAFDANNISINASSTVAPTSDPIINIWGNLTNDGVYNGQACTVVFNAFTTIDGIGTTNFSNVIVVDNAFVFLESSANLFGSLELQGSGSFFDADGGSDVGVFTIIASTPSLPDRGRIAPLENPVNFDGVVRLQQYLPSKTGGLYRYISSPVVGANLSLWRNSFGVTGNFSDKSTNTDFANISNSGNSNASVFTWNPAAQGYVAVASTPSNSPTSTVPLVNGTGYAAYDFRNDDFTITYVGEIGKGVVNTTLAATPGNYTLVANPYPAGLDWDLVIADNMLDVDGEISRRSLSGNFIYYNAFSVPPGDPNSSVVAIGQSFWVMTSNDGGRDGILSINETHKSTEFTGNFVRKSEPINYFRLKLASATQEDHAAVRFLPGSTDDKDHADAAKRFNGSLVSGSYNYMNFSTFTTSSAKSYAINSVDEIGGCSKTIGVRAADLKPGAHTLQFTELSKLELDYKITLIDHFLNTEKVVEDNMSYPFDVTANSNSFGSSRFEIRFDKISVAPVLTVQDQNLTSNLPTGNQWYKNGEILQGANLATYPVTTTGVYTLKVFSGTCENSINKMVMAVRSDAAISGCSKNLAMNVGNSVSPGDYKINFSGLSDVTGYSIKLIDMFLNTQTSVSDGTEYAFSITSDGNSFGASRFQLQFDKVTVAPVIEVEGQTLVSSAATGNQWYLNGQIIEGANASTYDVTQSGTYSVKTTVDGCELSAPNVTMTITALSEGQGDAAVIVYPNPTSGKIIIKLPRNEDALTGIYLYDVKGSVIVDSDKNSSLLKQGEKTIDISNSRSGVYFLNLVSAKEIKSIRLIKK